VPVSEETYETLKRMGTVGDTFDSVIKNLLQANEKPVLRQTILDEF
jgi:predicted CopG family antitoxin